MLDLNFVRENLALVEEKLRSRGMDPAAVLKDFREVDTERRRAITEAETRKAPEQSFGRDRQSKEGWPGRERGHRANQRATRTDSGTRKDGDRS